MKLPITDGESGPDMKDNHNVVHVHGGFKEWPPRAGDTQGITYKSFLGRILCEHPEKFSFFWCKYPGYITRKGLVCRSCGKITQSYIS